MSHITDIAVSINGDQEQSLSNQQFKFINVDLNTGTSGNPIYLWYKKGINNPITRLQVTFKDEMQNGLKNAGYRKVNRDLNAGAGGDYIYLWYYKGTTENDNAIEELKVTTNAEDEAQCFHDGWERLACDLNRKAKGVWIRVWMKREKKMYISDITATASFGSDDDYFSQGYTRVDEDISWYRQSLMTNVQCEMINSLDVSTNHDDQAMLQQQGYTQVGVNLNEGTVGNPIYVWYKKGLDNPIQTITVIFQHEVDRYEKAGIHVNENNLNTGNNGNGLYLAFQ